MSIAADEMSAEHKSSCEWPACKCDDAARAKCWSEGCSSDGQTKREGAMMIRIIVKEVIFCPDGAVTNVQYKTFDVACPELETFLNHGSALCKTSVVGAELLSLNQAGGES